MFGTIRKHQTWLWAVIITLTILSFVVFFSPTSKINSGQDEARMGSINGKQISRGQIINAQRDASLQYFFMSGGRWPDEESRKTGFDIERETYQWMLLLSKVEQMGIHISDDMVVDVARNMLSQFGRGGQVTPQQFSQQALEPRGYSIADFERFVRNYLSIQQLVATFGLPGRLVTPAEARTLFVRENQELAAEAVFFSPSNYLARVTVTPEAIGHYYSNHLAEYRLPERAQVKYVEFSLTNHLEMARAELAKTNLEEMVTMNLQRLGTNYLRYGTNETEVKNRIREELVRSRALIEARRKAAEFATVLLETDASMPQSLDVLATSNNLPVQVTKPFGAREIPEGLDVAENFATAAFAVRNATNEYFAGPIVGPGGVYVIGYHSRLPSEIPAMDQIRDKVTADFKQEQARGIATAAGLRFYNAATNGIGSGKEFTAVAAENNFQAVTLPPFSLASRSLPDIEGRITINELKQVAFALKPGEVSPYQPTSDGGIVLHLKSKLPLDPQRVETELTNFVNLVRQNRQSEAFNEWFRKEAMQGLRDTPMMAPKAPPNMSGGDGKARPAAKS